MKPKVCPLCISDNIVEIIKDRPKVEKKKYRPTFHCTHCGYEWSSNKTETLP